MKTTTLQKKLQAYAALAGAIAVPGIADGQIIYHDIDPDVTVSAGESYDLDLNNDGTVDFTLRSFINAGSFTKAEVYGNASLENNAVDASIGPLGYYYPRALEELDPIGPANDWVAPIPFATLVIAYTTGNVYGNWGGVDNGYLAMRFADSTNLHYGWLRMDVAVDGSEFTLKDFAYQATAEEPLNAGEQPVGIGNIPVQLQPDIFIADQLLMINLKQSLTYPMLTIYNMVGQQVLQKTIGSATTREDVSFLGAGNYLVSITAEEGMFSRKISLQ